MKFFSSAPSAVVPLLAYGTTVSGFCIDSNSAEVAMDVIYYIRAFPFLASSYLAVVPQGGAVVPRQQYCALCLSAFWARLVSAVWAVVPRGPAVVPRAPAVVPRLWYGSTALRRLSWWIKVGFVPPLYKGCLPPVVDCLFHLQAPLLLQAPFSLDLSP